MSERQEEIGQFFASHYRSLYRTAYYLTRSHSDADDLVGHAALRLALNWNKIRGDRAAWAHTVIRNKFKDDRKSSRYQLETPLEGRPDVGGGHDPEHAVVSREERSRRLEQLTDQEWQIFCMHGHEEISIEEVAARLYVSKSTVRRRWKSIERKLDSRKEKV